MAAGCAGEDEQGTGLLDVLAKVPANADTRVMVEYGAPSKVPDGDRFQLLRGQGYGNIAMSSRLVEDALHLDLAKFDSALSVGQPPRWAGALWGSYDTAGVEGEIADRGVDKKPDLHGGNLWNSGKDNEIDLADGPFAGVARTSEFNNIRTADGSFAYAPVKVGIDWVTGDEVEQSLANDDSIGPLARCLGDVIAATIANTGQAVGVRADNSEVVCLEGSKDDVLRALAGEVPSTREPWESLLPGFKVGESDGRIQITVPEKDGAPVGRVLRLMLTGDLRGLE